MRNKLTLYEPDGINNENIKTFNSLKGSSYLLNKKNPVYKILAAEGREDFIRYMESLGLTKDPNLVFLSSVRHYFYDADEMKSVKTVINLKELNQIKQLNSFLHSIFHILSQKSNFIGCFVDNKKVNNFEMRSSIFNNQKKISKDDLENGVASQIPFINMLYNIMDLKTYKFMSGNSVSLILEDHGFKVLDMKEINGLTYFWSQKVIAGNN